MLQRLPLLALVFLLPCAVMAGTNEFGKKFLEKNKAKEGVITLASGLQYRVLEEGDGEAHPLASTDCTCHYEGRTAQEYSKTPKGKKFDSSFDRGDPTNFAPSGVIAGWTEAMQLMVEGDKWELYIPSELGYGDSGQGADIGAGDVLVFTLHLLKINGESTPAEPRGPPPYATLETTAELDAWLKSSAAEGKTPVVALLRQPLNKGAKLFGGFRKAARQDDASAYALSAVGKYDPSSKKFTTSEVEAALGLSAPSVQVLAKGVGSAGEVKADKKAKAKACKTQHSQGGVSADDVAKTIAGCAKRGVKDEL